MVDFVEEVEEQLRSDRYRGMVRQAWPWFAAALVALVVGWLAAWGYNSWREKNIGRASIAYDKAITTLTQGDQTGAYTALDDIGKTGPAGYRMLALLQQGNIRLVAGKSADAAALYDRAAQVAPNAVLGDFARLRAAQALLDSAPYSQLEARLKALIGDKKPFDLNAREILAIAKLEAGQLAAAKADFNALTITLGVTQSMRARAQAAMGLIDSGQAAQIAEVAKVAATLPPPPPQSVNGVPGESAGPQAGAAQSGPPNNTAENTGNAQ